MEGLFYFQKESLLDKSKVFKFGLKNITIGL